ncbi:AraC family transcriptional regulator [Mediterraneibacter glycyrrhizinilyticus]|uniref:AraC family transcriptional regulator n=1 Tax=Mediterraneibacter glycyrrhizinilyticus TaxID=342942 RepID=UPI0019610A40|nr:AraC family transcriptional regulator [Mediterraneibacter glycyrrhizinilyticus]MBM6802536.1 AraC family transcriptional regulator [Mediterraneibacter glycyrrhizinilyticus]MDM8125480.1 AraC family transcriptional regulator [Mediterraneibacter glycyrrhizinilyticus]
MSESVFSIFPNENFVDLSLYQYGMEQCPPAYSFGPATRNHYLFHYVLSGTGRLIANDSKGISHEYQIRSGEGFMIFPRQINTYIADPKLPWEYIWIEFDGMRAREIIETAGLSPDHPVYHASYKDLRENMKDEMIYIAEHHDATPFHLMGHLYLFIDYLSRSSSSQITASGRVRDFYIKEALNYIEQNFQNDISVENIASFCGLNRTYFGRIFKETVGKSPQQFLLSYRMAKAAELLKLTELSISDIGNAVGYPNQLHFSRAFKNVYGVSPREWRNKNQMIR